MRVHILLAIPRPAWHYVGPRQQVVTEILVRLDTGIDDSDRDPVTAADPMSCGDIQVLQMPLIVTYLIGLSRAFEYNNCGRRE